MHDGYLLPGSSVKDVLLKTHSVLIHASNEQEIIAALALCTDELACLRLVYLDLDSAGLPASMTITANWKGGLPWRADPLLQRKLLANTCPLVSALQEVPDPIWFIDDVTEHVDLHHSAFLTDAGRLVAIKLFGVAQVEYPSRWHGIVCITWPAPGAFTKEERYIFAAICETASAIVSHRRLHVEALENVRQLRRLDALKTDFLRTVSHELRTPLVGILTGAEALLHSSSGAIGDEVRQAIDDTSQSGQHLLDVISDILDMAQIEAGALRLCLEPVDLAGVVQEAVQTIRAIAVDKGLTLTTNVYAGLPMIHADKRRIRQILLNLLSNAVKFSEQGIIRVEAHQEGQALVVSVQDEGIGISPEYHATIFDQFRRIDSLAARLAGGTGLGLPISKRLVELHGGRIWLTSELNRGSTFYFSLSIEGEINANSVH